MFTSSSVFLPLGMPLWIPGYTPKKKKYFFKIKHYYTPRKYVPIRFLGTVFEFFSAAAGGGSAFSIRFFQILEITSVGFSILEITSVGFSRLVLQRWTNMITPQTMMPKIKYHIKNNRRNQFMLNDKMTTFQIQFLLFVIYQFDVKIIEFWK